MHKILALTVSMPLLVAQSAQAHTGDHSGSLPALFAHLWSHANHWLPAVAAIAVIGSVAVLLPRPAQRSTQMPTREE